MKTLTSNESSKILFANGDLTLGNRIIKYCYSHGAKKVLSAVLVKKNLENKKPAENVDYFGFIVPNVYIFGYGMDYCEYHRNAPGIYAVTKS